MAALHLDQYDDVEVFNPRIQASRASRNGRVLVTESLFPNYLFARFDWRTSLAKVRYGRGVSGVVHFGERWPTIPDSVVQHLKEWVRQAPPRDRAMELRPGDEVTISVGALQGLEAVITQVMPARQRVMVLLDFLGRLSSVELESGSVEKTES